MSKQRLHMETTTISVAKTCGDIEDLLVEDPGVTRIWKDIYNGKIEGINFLMEIDGQVVPFKLPFKWREVQKLAEMGETGYKKTADEEQARRVAARLMFRWVEAQLSFIRTNQVKFDQLFMSFIMVDEHTTVYDRLMENGGVGSVQFCSLTGRTVDD